MDCKDVHVMTHSYVDGELDALNMARIESHATSCADCRRRLSEQVNLRTAIKLASPYYKAPAGLQQHIQARLRTPKQQRWPTLLSAWRWPNIGAVVSSVALFGVGLALVLATPSSEELLMREVISGHVRSLMADHLTDIRSTDKHTVKPWFIGQLDFSPPVTDLASNNYMLIGGRLDYLDNRQVAALVYQHRKHIINLFVMPTTRDQALNLQGGRWQGYEIYQWTQAGMNFWAVSDVNETDLRQFVHLLRSAPTAAPAK